MRPAESPKARTGSTATGSERVVAGVCAGFAD